MTQGKAAEGLKKTSRIRQSSVDRALGTSGELAQIVCPVAASIIITHLDVIFPGIRGRGAEPPSPFFAVDSTDSFFYFTYSIGIAQ
ncbi:MAG: hypothetical protein CSA32_05690 [Desulfobulbus propionicus]|nr:MAG: hypothetical protein CSA32_05690 [Desulfobulbus propionicus]